MSRATYSKIIRVTIYANICFSYLIGNYAELIIDCHFSDEIRIKLTKGARQDSKGKPKEEYNAMKKCRTEENPVWGNWTPICNTYQQVPKSLMTLARLKISKSKWWLYKKLY